MSRGMRDSDARGIELGDQSRLRTIDFENVDIKGYRKYTAGEATVAVVRAFWKIVKTATRLEEVMLPEALCRCGEVYCSDDIKR